MQLPVLVAWAWLCAGPGLQEQSRPETRNRMTWSPGKAGCLDTVAKNMYYNLVSVLPDFRDAEGKSHKPVFHVHPDGAAETSQGREAPAVSESPAQVPSFMRILHSILFLSFLVSGVGH